MPRLGTVTVNAARSRGGIGQAQVTERRRTEIAPLSFAGQSAGPRELFAYTGQR